MKFYNVMVALVVTVFFANAPVFATNCEQEPWHDHCKSTPAPTTPPPAPAQPVQATGTGYGGQAYGGYGSAEAAAAAFQKMNNAQRQEFKANVSTQDWTSIQMVLSLGAEATIRDNVIGGGQGGAGGQASGNGAGNMTTTTVGGTTYNYERPIAGAYVQLPPGVTSQGLLVVTTTTCGGDFEIEEVRNIKAVSNVAMGFGYMTRNNGRVLTVKSKGTGLEYGKYEMVGQDGDKLVEERTVSGYQAVIHAYLAGSSAASGGNVSLENGAVALSGSGGVQTYGNEIFKFPCSFKEMRKLSPAKVSEGPSADELAKLVAAQLNAKMELSAPAYEREFVPCPPKGCEAPKGGYYRFVRKDGAVKASTELGSKASAGTKK